MQSEQDVTDEAGCVDPARSRHGQPRGLRLRRTDRAQWLQIRHLYPGHTISTRTIDPLAVIGPLAEPARNPGGNRVRLSPGLLRGPGFNPQAAWVSGTAGGALERALARPARPAAAECRRALSLVRALAAARVGGSFWRDPLPGGPERIVLRPETPAALDAMVQRARAAHEAAHLLLLLPERTPPQVVERARRLGLAVIAGRFDPWSVIERADALHVGGDDELGLLGLLAGRAVHCHTPGRVTGWGLGIDAPGIPRRPPRTDGMP